jgi:5-methylcytosine-specific restriction protein A
MTESEILDFFQTLDYETDARRFPDAARSSRFRVGWRHAVEDREYRPETLLELAWQNLGYRYGRKFGEQTDDEIDRAFEVLALEYRTARLHALMEGLYRRTGRAADYWPGRFLKSVRQHGGLATAKRLLDPAKGLSEGFRRLVAAHRADLSVEALVLDPRFSPLFTDDELEVARERLRQLPPSAFPQTRDPEDVHPETLPADGDYHEGGIQRVTINRYERSREARAVCLRSHGVRCAVCTMSFEEVYGSIGAGFIHVHHRHPIYLRKEHYRLDPRRDLVPVCPNCHAMLHTHEPPLEVEDLRSRFLRSGDPSHPPVPRSPR